MLHFVKYVVLSGLLCSPFFIHAVTPFKDGEKIVFLGDSITQGSDFICWTQAVCQLRCQGKVRLENAGISGDSAGGGAARLGYDVLERKPDRVFVMFGMNDLGVTLYAKGGMELEGSRLKRLENYKKNINRICDRLKEAGVTAVLMTPTPYNQYGKNNKSTYNEAGLSAAAEFIRKTAKERGLEIVEFHVPMTEILKKQPEISPMRPDNVHPNELGHLVMTYYLCKAAGLEGKIAEVRINAAEGKVETANHAVVRDVKITHAGNLNPDGKGATGISFEYTPKRLPFLTDKRHKGIDTLVPFKADFNTETLQVTGLAEGNYQLLANRSSIGKFTAAELAKGINLAGMYTPSRQQALKVFRQISAIRACMSRLRSVAAGDRYALSQKADVNDVESCCRAADRWLKVNVLDKKGSNIKYYTNVIESYKKNKALVPKIRKQLDNAYENLYRESHPVSCRIELRKLQGK